MSISLYDHQKTAIEKLRSGSILCGGVGSGKSRTSLVYFLTKECDGDLDTGVIKKPKNLYIITTARKRDTLEWDKECADVRLSKNEKISMGGIKVTVDSWNNISKYVDVKDSFFIFDEQRLVGSGAWVQSFHKIAKTNRWILLSATPGDTWSDYAPVFIANGFYKNITEFRMRHVVYSRFSKYPKIDRYVDTKRLAKFRAQITVDMPFDRDTVRHYETVFVSYDSFAYKTLNKERWNVETNRPIKNASELCYALRKLINSDPSRLGAVVDLMEKHNKLIVFYNFDYELDILRTLDGFNGFTISEWNGHKHEPIPKSDKWLYLVQYTSGAEGWNCVETDSMIFYSQNYSYKIMEQSSGRIDRMNTPFKDLYYYTLRCNAPIDLAILKAIKSKKKFNESAFVRF